MPRKLIEKAPELTLDGVDEPGQDEGHAEAWDAEIERRVRADDNDEEVVADGRGALRQLRDEILGR